MPKEVLDEREFELINILGGQLADNQRDLSRRLNLSLGMTNMILKRMVTKGYIRIQQLNSRKVRYLLTPKGFSEKMRKSVKYTLKTINSISLIKNRLKDVLFGLYQDGQREFIVVGKSDLAYLIDIVIREQSLIGCRISHFDQVPTHINGAYVLICTEEGQLSSSYEGRGVNLIHELSKDYANEHH